MNTQSNINNFYIFYEPLRRWQLFMLFSNYQYILWFDFEAEMSCWIVFGTRLMLIANS